LYLTELLYRQKENTKLAIEHGNDSIKYCEWYDKSMYLSEKIKSVVSDNSLNIGIFLPNSIEYAIAYFSILFSGRVIVPMGAQSKGPEVIGTLNYCEIDLLVTSLKYKNFLVENMSNYGYKLYILFIEDNSVEIINGDRDFQNKSASQNSLDEDNVAIMLHTSGTTSNPKRVMLTHNNLINNVESNIESLKLTGRDKVLISMPMHFGYCNTAQFLTHLYLGAPMVIFDGLFMPKEFFQIVQNKKITNFTGVPSMLLMLLEYRYGGNYDINSLRYVCFGGGKMPIDKLNELIVKYPSVGFVQTYGQTEASPRSTALLPEDSLKKIGSVGLPIPNVKIKIIDETGKELNAGESGEIVIQGKNVMKGYYKQNEITKKTIIDGWLHSGDLGYIDSDGYLYLTGRIKNIIISGGINIYPEEVEDVIIQYPGISEVCVESEDHILLGEIPVAKIVLKAEIDYNELKKFCTERLSEYKVPRKFEVVESLPKTYNGKIKRF